MSLGLLLKERMSGWLQLDGEAKQDFAFDIRAFTTQMLSLTAPRYFQGTVTLGDLPLPCEGELTIQLSGPHYWLTFDHPKWGRVRAEGKKHYGRNGLIASLITCPLTLSRDRQTIGTAEVAYRDSMVAFPFKALRLVSEDRAYGDLTP
ncbi:hypothetical protein [Alcanivorax sp. DP30]|uniref:hypothetical protein n=1 Tax=Alcanivorax sp. DP30 TaxID=2606217 RepID=UPI0013691AE6|nr:hypothetical protein [Alcanivorax sp. DP30]MZR61323.1 hypothetical protein [Alcanivorax sp. DP30]